MKGEIDSICKKTLLKIDTTCLNLIYFEVTVKIMAIAMKDLNCLQFKEKKVNMLKIIKKKTIRILV